MARPTIPDNSIAGTEPGQLVFCFMPWLNKIAYRYKPLLDNYPVFDVDDLIQAGSIGLLKAQKTYNPEEGGFLAYSRFFIMKEIRATIGITTGKLPPVLDSLDKPLSEDDPEGDSFIDLVPDPAAVDLEEHAISKDVSEKVRDAVSNLPNKNQSEVIERVYFYDQNRKEAASGMGIKSTTLQGIEHEALKKLERNTTLQRLVNYAPHHISLNKFRNTWSSEQEIAILRAESRYDSQHGSGAFADTIRNRYEKDD